jgi:hypothetical protein
MDDNFDKQNIEENEKEGELISKTFILDFKKVMVLAGVGAFGYLIGKRDGFNFGYVNGYRRCVENVTEILITTNKLR